MLANQRSALFMSHSKAAVNDTQAILIVFFLFEFKVPAQDWIRTGVDWFWFGVFLSLRESPLAMNLGAAEEAVLVPPSHVSSLHPLVTPVPAWSCLQRHGPECAPLTWTQRAGRAPNFRGPTCPSFKAQPFLLSESPSLPPGSCQGEESCRQETRLHSVPDPKLSVSMGNLPSTALDFPSDSH